MVITNLKFTRNGVRVNVYLDSVFAFSVSQKLISEYRLYQGKKLSKEKVKEIKGEDEFVRYYERVVGLLGRRPRSVGEVGEYLKRTFHKKEKEYGENLTERILSELEKKNLLNDENFTRWWVEGRIQFKPRGRLLLRQELRQKKVSENLIQKVFAEFSLTEETEYKQALVLARKRKEILNLTEKKDRDKLVSYLLRKGFSYEIIKKVLFKLINTAREFKY
ncbi:MAG: RecX family transcriptional regulator [Patescibacteria group bacterium]|nr:RecX family transcriptional regulator [Patescibacteria group bacterium]